MDGGEPAAEATNTFFEEPAVNAWDAEGKSLFLRIVSNEFLNKISLHKNKSSCSVDQLPVHFSDDIKECQFLHQEKCIYR